MDNQPINNPSPPECPGPLRADEVERLRASEELNRAILDTVFDGIVVIDEDAMVVRFNPAAEKIFGYKSIEVIGNNVSMLMPEPYRSEHDTFLRNYLATGVKKIIGIGREVEGRRKDGSVFPLALAVTEMRKNGGRMFTGILRDITDRKQLEQQKADFYAMVTHDLKSPLTSIMGFAELIATGKDADADTVEMSTGILSASKKLYGLVEQFLLQSRLESGAMTLNLRREDAAGLIMELKEEFSEQARRNGLTLTATVEDGLPAILVDRTYIMRALANLAQNAVNYTPEGGEVALSATRRIGDTGDFVVLSVSDTGPGIAPEDQAKVFQKYFRAEGRAGTKGAGLGLAIVKAVAEAHKGRVELKSEPGKGSVFSLILPTAAAPAA